MSNERGLFGEKAPSAKPRAAIRDVTKQSWEPTTKAQRQEFFLPVSGFIWFYPEEISIIDHPSFQRLGLVNQLGQSFYVYRGATHKRLEHVLGVVGVVQEMISAIKNTSKKGEFKRDSSFAPKLTFQEERFVRLGALLHDIGHLAAGHTLEDELEIVGKHDADKRISLVFEKTDWGPQDTAPLGALIDEHYTNYLPDSLRDKVSAQMVVRLLIRKPPKEELDPFSVHSNELKKNSDIRYDLCRNIIGNTICADLLDYLYRDWYHIGKTRSKDDRIFQYMELRRQTDNRMPSHDAGLPADTRSPNDRYVISLGGRSKIRSDGVSSILGLLEWRYELAEAVLYHRTKVAAGAMLDRALFSLWGSTSEDDLVDKFLQVSDDQLLELALSEAKALGEEKRAIVDKLIGNLKARSIFGTLVTSDASTLAPEAKNRADSLYRSKPNDKSAAINRDSAARNLELDFDLPPGSVVIYCLSVKAKLADVSVAIDGQIESLANFENNNSQKLSGGHLSAQVARFEKLWRIHFFMDDTVRRRIGEVRTSEIIQFIKQVILSAEDENSVKIVLEQCARLREAKLREEGVNNINLKTKVLEFAKGNSEVVNLPKYPGGSLCLRNLLGRNE